MVLELWDKRRRQRDQATPSNRLRGTEMLCPVRQLEELLLDVDRPTEQIDVFTS
jgi:hypothetical protein